jgi:hypothetical protein
LFWDGLTRFGVEKDLGASALDDNVTLTRLRAGVRTLACDSIKVASDPEDAILIF